MCHNLNYCGMYVEDHVEFINPTVPNAFSSGSAKGATVSQNLVPTHLLPFLIIKIHLLT